MIESLLYIAIVSILLVSLTTFFSLILQSKNRSQTISEVDNQGLIIMHLMTRTIRNSTSITSPSVGVSASSLTLVVPDGTRSPTIFNATSGVLNITEGTGAAITLSSNRIIISNLSFNNVTKSGTTGTIKISFTLTYNNTAGRQEFNYSQTYNDSASINI